VTGTAISPNAEPWPPSRPAPAGGYPDDEDHPVDVGVLQRLHRGTERELDLHEVDDELRRHFSEQLGAMGVVTMGRAAYELMAGAWPTLGSTRERGSYVARQANSALA